MRKKGTIKALVRNETLWAVREIIRGTLKFLLKNKLYKISGLTVEQRGERPFWLSTAKDEVKLWVPQE
jgi:hypothetical protein